MIESVLSTSKKIYDQFLSSFKKLTKMERFMLLQENPLIIRLFHQFRI